MRSALDLSDMQLLKGLNDLGYCSGCDPDRAVSYCCTYLGPCYVKSKLRVLFVGLDHGKESVPQRISAEERRADIVKYRDRQEAWNYTHYQGCVRVASLLLGSRCQDDCSTKCAQKPESDCALLQFAQANAVKCSGQGSGMTFKNQEIVPDCLPLVFKEMQSLRPEVVVLQGRDKRTGLIHIAFQEAAKHEAAKDTAPWEETRNENEYVGQMTWKETREKCIVLSLRHPSMRWLSRDWDPVIVPAARCARKLLELPL